MRVQGGSGSGCAISLVVAAAWACARDVAEQEGRSEKALLSKPPPPFHFAVRPTCPPPSPAGTARCTHVFGVGIWKRAGAGLTDGRRQRTTRQVFSTPTGVSPPDRRFSTPRAHLGGVDVARVDQPHERLAAPALRVPAAHLRGCVVVPRGTRVSLAQARTLVRSPLSKAPVNKCCETSVCQPSPALSGLAHGRGWFHHAVGRSGQQLGVVLRPRDLAAGTERDDGRTQRDGAHRCLIYTCMPSLQSGKGGGGRAGTS